jgi:GTPase SAR1 family protein
MADLEEKVKGLGSVKSQAAILEHLKNLLVESDLPQKIKDIQNLTIYHFRDLTTNESELISEVFKVKTIKDLAKVSYDQVMQNMTLLRKGKITKKKLEMIISAARFIVEAADYKPTDEKKVVLAGLANAGKSAMLKVIKRELIGAVEELSLLKPTLGLQRNEIEIKGQKFNVFELGGQEVYRKAYIETPGRFFLGTDIIIYLIDMQDERSQPESLDYFQNILNVVKYLQESPEFIVLLHKCDPDLLDNPRFLEGIDNMERRVTELFQSGQYDFRFEIQTSSIFNSLAPTPNFSKMMRGLFNKGLLDEKKKIEAIGDLVTSVVDLILGIEKTVDERLKAVEQQIQQLSQQALQAPPAPAGAQAASMPPVEPFKPTVEVLAPVPPPPKSPKDALMGELKTLFAKKRLVE